MPAEVIDASQKVRVSEFTTEEHVAMNYALAELYPEKYRKRYEAFLASLEAKAQLAGLRMPTTADMKSAVYTGLLRLAERGVLMVRKDGMGVYQPAHIRFEVLIDDGNAYGPGPGLIIGNGN